MKKYAICNMTRGNAYWQVHKAGCADVTRGEQRLEYNAVDIVQAESPEQAVQNELAWANGELREMGYDEDSYRIMPCCKHAPSA